MIFIPKKQERPKFSQYISDVISMCENATRDYVWSKERIVKMDELTQDYLHKLELEPLPYGERAKLATALRDCRQVRREHKDTVEILEPLVNFVDSERGKRLLDLLREALGKTRRAEEKMAHRVYRHRVLDEEDIK